MTTFDTANWEHHFHAFIQDQQVADASHGLDHIERVVAAAKKIGHTEKADQAIFIPAAWLHDCVVVEKNSSDRYKASTFAAEEACAFLKQINYPAQYLDPVFHAIQAHSFSANIPTETLEARVVQDADRLDALGAIGLARCLMTGERMGIPLYHPKDPFCVNRTADDSKYITDHFYAKLFTLPDTMKTNAGREEAQRRVQFLKHFLKELGTELPDL